MIKEFPLYFAWTDSMTYGYGFAGFIGYQRKEPESLANILWVIAPSFRSLREAESAAEFMLDHICEITRSGNVIYSDGVML